MDWRSRSKCQKLTPNEFDDMFFPEAGRAINRAKLFCKDCPVFTECLQFALDNKVSGIWAGTSSKERKGIHDLNRVARGLVATPQAALKVKKRKRNVVFS